MELTAKYKVKVNYYAILRPFRVDTEQLELLEPIERIEIENINDIRPKKKEEGFSKKPGTKYKFTLLTDISTRLSSNSKLFTDNDYLENVVIPWMEIFLWFFEAGYYEDIEMLDVLRRVKENFKFFNEINLTDFVQWYSKFAITFIKAALFKIQCKLIKESIRSKRSFRNKVSSFLGEDIKDDADINLSFGRLFLP